MAPSQSRSVVTSSPMHAYGDTPVQRLPASVQPTITFDELKDACEKWLSQRPALSPAKFHRTRVEQARKAICRLVNSLDSDAEINKDKKKYHHIWILFCYEYQLLRVVKEASEEPGVLALAKSMSVVKTNYDVVKLREFCHRSVPLGGKMHLRSRPGILRWWLMIESDWQITKENLVAYINAAAQGTSEHDLEESEPEISGLVSSGSPRGKTRARFAELPEPSAGAADPSPLPARRDQTTGFLLNDSVRSAGGGQIEAKADGDYKSDHVPRKKMHTPPRGANSNDTSHHADGTNAAPGADGDVGLHVPEASQSKKKRGRRGKSAAPGEDGRSDKQDPWRLPAGAPLNLDLPTTLSEFYSSHGWDSKTKTVAKPVEVKHVLALMLFHGLAEEGVDFARKCTKCIGHGWRCVYRNKGTCLGCFEKKWKCEAGAIPAVAEGNSGPQFAPLWERRVSLLKRFKDEGIFTMPAAYYSQDGVPAPSKPRALPKNTPAAQPPRASPAPSPAPGAAHPSPPPPRPSEATHRGSAPAADIPGIDGPSGPAPGSSGPSGVSPAPPSRRGSARPRTPEERSQPSRPAPILPADASPAPVSTSLPTELHSSGDFKAAEGSNGAIDVDAGDVMEVDDDAPFMAAMDPPIDATPSSSGPAKAISSPSRPRMLSRSAAQADARREAGGLDSEMLDPREVLGALAAMPTAVQSLVEAIRERQPSRSGSTDERALEEVLSRVIPRVLPNLLRDALDSTMQLALPPVMREHVLPALQSEQNNLRSDFQAHASAVQTSVNGVRSAFKEHGEKLEGVHNLVTGLNENVRAVKEDQLPNIHQLQLSHDRLLTKLGETMAMLGSYISAPSSRVSSSGAASSEAPRAAAGLSSGDHPVADTRLASDMLDRAMEQLEIRTNERAKDSVQTEVKVPTTKHVGSSLSSTPTAAKSQIAARASLDSVPPSDEIGANTQEDRAGPRASSSERLAETHPSGPAIAPTTAVPAKTSLTTTPAGPLGEAVGNHGDHGGASDVDVTTADMDFTAADMDVDDPEDAPAPPSEQSEESESSDGISASEDEAGRRKPSRGAAAKRKREDPVGEDVDSGKTVTIKQPRKRTRTEPPPVAPHQMEKLRDRVPKKTGRR